MTNQEKYNEVFKKIFGVEEAVLNEDFTTENVEKWDSVTQMQLVTALEDAFDIMLDTDDIFELNSYKNGMQILKKYEVEI